MTNEVREAAERLRRQVQTHDAYRFGQPGKGDEWRDLWMLYHAEHPADDETPIDEAWLRSVGGKEGGDRYWDFVLSDYDGSVAWLRVHSPLSGAGDDGECMTDLMSNDGNGTGITNWPKTRGQLRLLARALGIELKPRSEP